ncbi:MAG: hypothetical protein PHY43_01115 [Verrucomicrobiales bacterium]|nr:hypothetical protein [Verrucomicrobiales bacterium]
MFESIEANSAKAMTGLFKYFPPDKMDFFENRLVLLTPPKFLNDPWDFFAERTNANGAGGKAATQQSAISRELQACAEADNRR